MRRLLLLPLCLSACSPPAPESAGARAIHFTDVTASSGIDFTLTNGGDPPRALLEVKGTGIALIDFDRDGDSDVFVPNGATLGSPGRGPGARLFENLGGMRFRDVSHQYPLPFRRWGFGCAVGDLDGDGFDDLFLACYGRNALLRNLAGRGFQEVGVEAGLVEEAWSTAACVGDVDEDGDLDVYVANYFALDLSRPLPQSSFMGERVMGGPMGMPAQADHFYVNRGDGTFEERATSAGLHAPAASYGLGAVILDFDQDGFADIYVGNDSEANFLFRGRGDGTFEDLGLLSGIALGEGGAGQATMGIALSDVDGNGLVDVFTTNFMYDTNSLHMNQGGMFFEEQASRYGLSVDSRPYLSWGTGFCDFDHDGDEDLVFFNGHIYPEELCEARGWGYRQRPVLYERSGARFRALSPDEAGAWLAEPHCDRSAAFGDLDDDGDVDLVVCERNGPIRVLRNDRDGGAWLIVALRDPRPGRDPHGYGSRIELRSKEGVQRRWIASGTSFLAASEPIAHFGFGADPGPLTVEVTWPDGRAQVFEGVRPGGRRLLIR